jgi:hypothetical protein
MVDEIERNMAAESKWWIPEHNILFIVCWRRPTEVVLSGDTVITWFHIHRDCTLWENLEKGTIASGWLYECIVCYIDFGDFVEDGPTLSCHLIGCEELVFC